MARILVIDDNADVRHAIRVSLEMAEHRVEQAIDGTEGVALYAKKPFDLVICDISMPGKDGIESLLELKTDFPDVKLIAISGKDEAFLATAREFGAVKTLAKPFAPRKLVAMVAEVLAEGERQRRADSG